MDKPPDANNQADFLRRLACVLAAKRLDLDDVVTDLRSRQLSLTQEPDEVHDELGMGKSDFQFRRGVARKGSKAAPSARIGHGELARHPRKGGQCSALRRCDPEFVKNAA